MLKMCSFIKHSYKNRRNSINLSLQHKNRKIVYGENKFHFAKIIKNILIC